MDNVQSLGECLRVHRQEKGLSLQDIASLTKIPLRYLQALEDDHYEQLPAETYLKGFLANYAEALDLSIEKILEQYHLEYPERVKTTLTYPSVTMTCEPSSLFSETTSIIAILLLLLAVTGVGVWFFGMDRESGSEDTELVNLPPAETAIDPLKQEPLPVFPETSVTEAAAQMKAAAAIILPAVMELKAIRTVLVEVAIDGRPVQSYTLQPGSLLRWRIHLSVVLQIKPADAVQVRFSGAEVTADSSGRYIFPPVEP